MECNYRRNIIRNKFVSFINIMIYFIIIKVSLCWLNSELALGGADISFQTFPYHHFDAELTVWSVGKSIEAEPLYYSFIGQRNLSNIATGIVNAHGDEGVISHEIGRMVDEAKEYS